MMLGGFIRADEARGGYRTGPSRQAAHAVLADLFAYVADVNPAEEASER